MCIIRLRPPRTFEDGFGDDLLEQATCAHVRLFHENGALCANINLTIPVKTDEFNYLVGGVVDRFKEEILNKREGFEICLRDYLSTKKIAKAARMRAFGQEWKEIAAAIHVTIDGLKGWRKRHRQLWEAAESAAMQKMVDEVREAAGTPKMLADMHEYSRAADAANRWSKNVGTPLFPQPVDPHGAEHTLRTFFENYYRPVCMSQGCEESIYLYRKQLNLWERLTGNPPLKAITNITLAAFRDAMLRQPLKHDATKTLSVWTCRSVLRTIQTFLDHAGPPSQRNRDAAGFIDSVPWVKQPQAELDVPKIVPPEHLKSCYEAAARMTVPASDNFEPAAYWRALLVTAYNTGLRRRALLGLRWENVDFEKGLITVPPAINKTRKRLVLPMNAVVFSHLALIKRGPGDHVFRCHWKTAEGLRKALHNLQALAGIAPDERFQLHRLRKTCSTVLWAQDPGAAQAMLGHATLAMTRDIYTNAPAVLAEAVKNMSQPWSEGGAK